MKKKLILLFCVVCALATMTACLNSQDVDSLKNSTVSVNKFGSENIMEPDQQKIWVPVLVYHHIGFPPKNVTSSIKSFFISPEWFEKHLQYLKDNGFETITFADASAYFEYGMPLPERSVIISFDDGNGNVYTNAFPLLKKYNMKATLFLTSNFLDHGSYVTLKQVEEMRDAGFEIGSHTVSHPYLTKSSRARQEIFDSKKALEEKLGINVSAFAYPFGNYDQRIENLVKEAGYKTGRSFSTGNGISQEKMFHIPVVRVYANVGLERWKKQLFKY